VTGAGRYRAFGGQPRRRPRQCAGRDGDRPVWDRACPTARAV